MAEPEDISESEAEGGEPAGPGVGLAAALALGPGRRRGREKGDPEVDAFLKEQTRLARMQAEHLHEHGDLQISHLRWRRFSDQMKATLQAMTIVVGLAAASAVAVMA